MDRKNKDDNINILKNHIIKNKYKLESIIVQGSYGFVYNAKHLQKEYQLVFKFVSK